MRSMIEFICVCLVWLICSTEYAANPDSVLALIASGVQIIEEGNDVFLDYSVLFRGDSSSFVIESPIGVQWEVEYCKATSDGTVHKGLSAKPKTDPGFGSMPTMESVPLSPTGGQLVATGTESFRLIHHCPHTASKYQRDNLYAGRLLLCSTKDFREMLSHDGKLTVTLVINTLELPLSADIKTPADFLKRFSKKKTTLEMTNRQMHEISKRRGE